MEKMFVDGEYSVASAYDMFQNGIIGTDEDKDWRMI